MGNVISFIQDSISGLFGAAQDFVSEDSSSDTYEDAREPSEPRRGVFREDRDRFRRVVYRYTIPDGVDYPSIPDFFSAIRDELVDMITTRRGDVAVIVTAVAQMITNDGEIVTRRFDSGEARTVWGTWSDDHIYDVFTNGVMADFGRYLGEGSGQSLYRLLGVNIRLIPMDRIRAGEFVGTPEWVAKRKAVTNILADDDKCFLHSVARGIFGSDNNPNRLDEDLLQFEGTIDHSMLEFPMDIKGSERSIADFERTNGVSITMLAVDPVKKETVYPFRKPSERYNKEVVILNITEGEKSHFVLVSNLERLIRDQIGCKTKFRACPMCLTYFTGKRSEDKLDLHKKVCLITDPMVVILPKKGSTVRFVNHHMGNMVPLCIIFDFESFTHRVDDNSNRIQSHKPSGFYCQAVYKDPRVKFRPFHYTATYEDEDVASVFYQGLYYYLQECLSKLDELASKVPTSGEVPNRVICSYCRTPMKDGSAVVSKDLFTHEVIGVDHKKCSKRRLYTEFTPIAAHNNMGYDSKLYLDKLNDIPGKMTCIASNNKRMKFFTKEFKFSDGVTNTLRFIDTMAFQRGTLDDLVSSMTEGDMRITRKGTTPEEFAFVMEKGIFPYDHFNRYSVLSETFLPNKESFYSELHAKDVTDKEYKRALDFWNKTGCQTIRDYHDKYCKIDTLQLADFVMSFRNVSMEGFGIDPFWKVSAPGFSWEIALKKSGAKIDLITDPTVLDIVERSIRGGVTCGMEWYFAGNNPYMGELYDPSKPTSYILYFDINSMYATAMTKPLPLRNLRPMTDDQLENWRDYPCFIEADCEFPEDLHDLLNEFPLAPYKRDGKLMADFYGRVDYPMHYAEAKCYERHGMIIGKPKRGVIFEEESYFKSYIDDNVILRNENRHIKYKSDYYKLLNNAVYGKTVENKRRYREHHIVDNEEDYRRLTSMPNYAAESDIADGLVLVEMKNTSVEMDKPLHVGAAILGISKSLIFDFYYDVLKPLWGDNVKCMYTDTDSLIIKVHTEDAYEDMAPLVSDHFDTSNYPKDHPLHSLDNKGKLGMMKDEAGGSIITSFACVAPKVYSVKGVDFVKRRAKGTKKMGLNTLTHDDFEDVAKGGEERRVIVKQLKGTGLADVGLIEQNRVALRSNRSKRHEIEGSFLSYAHGHYATSELFGECLIKNENT